MSRFLPCLLLLFAPACALLGKSEPLEVRYFEVVTPAAEQTAAKPITAGAEQPPLRLRLGAIKSARYLDERIVSRRSESEVRYDDQRRWTEQPVDFVRRALLASLYEDAGYARVLSGPGITLEVELTAFELLEKELRARVELDLQLHDDRQQLLQRTLRVEIPVKGKADTEQLAHALGAALSQVANETSQLAGEVLREQAEKVAATRQSSAVVEPAAEAAR